MQCVLHALQHEQLQTALQDMARLVIRRAQPNDRTMARWVAGAAQRRAQWREGAVEHVGRAHIDHAERTTRVGAVEKTLVLLAAPLLAPLLPAAVFSFLCLGRGCFVPAAFPSCSACSPLLLGPSSACCSPLLLCSACSPLLLGPSCSRAASSTRGRSSSDGCT